MTISFWSIAQTDNHCHCDSECANQIAQKIWTQAMGQNLDECPKVIYKTEKKYAACFCNSEEDKKHPIIRIDPKWVDSLHIQFGKKCSVMAVLASIIGHELHHKLKNEQSGYYAHFGQYQEFKNMEEEADKYGLLYAQAIGYTSVFELFPQIFSTMDYENQKGYPTKIERSAFNEEVIKKAQTLILPFETANYLPFIGARKTDYLKTAIDIYEGIEGEISSFKQLKYAKGLAYLIYAIGRSETDNIYPIEIPSSDFLNLRRGEGKYSEEVINALMESKKLLTEILKFSPNDFDTHLALVAVELELELSKIKPDFGKPYDRIGKIENLPNLQPHQLQKTRLMFAIIKHCENPKEGVKRLSEIENNQDYPDNLRNIAQLNLEKNPNEINTIKVALPTIDGITSQFEKHQNLDLFIPFLTLENGYRIFFEQKENSKIVRIETFSNTLVFQESASFKTYVSSDFLNSMSPQKIGGGYFYLFELEGENGKVIVETNEKKEIKTVKKLLIIDL